VVGAFAGIVGLADGRAVGITDGCCEGTAVGKVGIPLGDRVGIVDGRNDGFRVGRVVGIRVGLYEGIGKSES
jgi:hypothetical protein